MLKEKELCTWFYSKCKNYTINLKKYDQVKLEYEKILNDQMGVRSPSMKDVILENAVDPYHTWRYEPTEKKDELLLQMNSLLYDIHIVDKVRNEVSSIEIVELINECYIYRNKCHEAIAADHNLNKKRMYRMINAEILKILQK